MRAMLFLKFTAPSLLLLLTGAYFFGNVEIERELTRLRGQSTLNVGLGVGALSRNLEALALDLTFLINHSALNEAINNPNTENIASLAEDFANFSRSKGIYDQIRWLDETGMERVRVDYRLNQSQIVPTDRLQNKGKRYYFSDTFKLKAGEIFVSPLDLNIERGEVTIPFKPMIRIGSPIVDRQGVKRGIILLNYYGEEMLQEFNAVTSNFKNHISILNNEGFWLKSSNSNDEWGFMFKRDALKLGNRNPRTWSEIHDKAEGTIINESGIWTWSTVYPLLVGMKTSTGVVDAFVPSRSVLETRKYFWKVVAHQESRLLTDLKAQIWSKTITITALLLTLIGFSGWKLARAEEKVYEINTGLEQLTEQLHDKVVELEKISAEHNRVEVEKTRLLNELHQSQKMDALGNLTGGIAHDFNNILGIIMGNTELAQNSIGKVNDAKLRKHLDTIQTASERARGLVSQMMVFSRSDQGEHHPMELTPMVKEDIRMLKAILPTSIEIDFDYQKNLPKVMMDPVKLQQILMNLCVNAKDAMDGIGTLSIWLGMCRDINQECTTCYERLRGDWVGLAVTDTGSGIAHDSLSRIFDPFFTSKEVGKGTGMGLAVVDSIVKSLDGHITVQSEQGTGTTFLLLFPPVQLIHSLEPDENSNHIVVKGSGQSILIVDDEPELALILSEMLEIYGYQSTAIFSSTDALKLFKSNPTSFDLVITDQTMPQLTGMDMATKMRNIRQEIPIIISTGYSDTIGQKEAGEQGIDFLKKPVNVNNLCSMVAELLSKS